MLHEVKHFISPSVLLISSTNNFLYSLLKSSLKSLLPSSSLQESLKGKLRILINSVKDSNAVSSTVAHCLLDMRVNQAALVSCATSLVTCIACMLSELFKHSSEAEVFIIEMLQSLLSPSVVHVDCWSAVTCVLPWPVFHMSDRCWSCEHFSHMRPYSVMLLLWSERDCTILHQLFTKSSYGHQHRFE